LDKGTSGSIITNAQSRWELNPIGLLPAARWRRHKMSEDTTSLCHQLAKIYTELWHLSDNATPPVKVLYRPDMFGSFDPGQVGKFVPYLEDKKENKRDLPQIWIKRTPPPVPEYKPDPDGADLRELITLAHERGHEQSWRDKTYMANTIADMANTIAEERRAWDHAECFLRKRRFEHWTEFNASKQESLDQHVLVALRRKFAAQYAEHERKSMGEERLREFCRLNNPGEGDHDFAPAVEQFIADPEGLITRD
jgi:hypothetical protein